MIKRFVIGAVVAAGLAVTALSAMAGPYHTCTTNCLRQHLHAHLLLEMERAAGCCP